LEYLTSVVVVFGDADHVPLDRGVRGIDRRPLRLQARLSHEKRMRKLEAIFPNTIMLLGDSRLPMIREFTEACPPTSAGFIENARQFRDFIWRRQEQETLKPPYLHEVAACELGLAEVRAFSGDWDCVADIESCPPRNCIRRHPGVVLLRCAYDIRSVFVKGEADPTRRDTRLAINMTPGSEQPAIFELAPAIFDLLAVMDDWAHVATLDVPFHLNDVICDLTKHGLIQTRLESR
jgi:hypothetical protein